MRSNMWGGIVDGANVARTKTTVDLQVATADIQLFATMPNRQFIDVGGAARNVTLPPILPQNEGMWFAIRNTGGGAFAIQVKDAGAVNQGAAIATGKTTNFYVVNQTWVVEGF